MPTSPIRVVAASLVALLAGCSTAKVKRQGVEMPPLQFAMRSLTYASGLRVLVERDTRTKLAGVFLVVGAGSSSDPAGKEGLAHFVEHLAYRSRPIDGRPLRKLLEEAGAFHYNAFTEFDETVYYELGLASELRELLRVEGARMLDPVSNVPDAVLRTERDVVENELRQDNETGYAGDVLREIQAAVFPKDHPYGRPVIGTLQSIHTLEPSDVQAFVRTHYRADNMTLLVLGDVDLETADRLVAESLPAQLLQAPTRIRIPQRMPAAAPSVPASPPASPQLEPRTAPVNAPQIWIGWSLPRSFDTDGYLLAFVKQAAQQRLSRVAFDDKDIASVRVNVIPGLQASLLVCRVVLYQNAHPEQTRDRVLNEVPRIWTTGSQLAEDLSEYAFSIVRRVVTVAEVSAAQNLVARGVKRATISHFSQDPTVYSRAVRELTAMRRKQLSEFAGPYLTKERARAVLFVPRAGTLATSAPPPGEAAQVADVEPDTDAGQVTMERAEGIDATKVADRLRRLFSEGEATTSKLPNGLTVVVQRRPGFPLVSAGLLLPAVRRSVEETAAAEVAFVAAHPAHLRNGPPELFGGFIRKWRPADSIVYAVEGASGNAEILLATLAEYARSMSVARVDWASIRERVKPYWKRSEEDPRVVASRKLYAALLRGHPVGPGVTFADLERLPPDAVKGWIERTHSPASATLVIVGDIEPADAVRWVAESFGSWTGAAPADAPPPSIAAAAPAAAATASDDHVLVTNRAGATQTQIEFACLLPPVADSATAARHAVGAAVLQERLWRVEREELGATYGPAVFAAMRRDGDAFLEVGSLVEPGKLAPALAALKRTLASFGERPLSADEVAAAKMRLASRAAAAQMTNLGIVWSQLMKARLGYALAGPDAAAQLGAVSPDDIRSDFQACSQGNPTLSLVGDENNVRAAVQAGWR